MHFLNEKKLGENLFSCLLATVVDYFPPFFYIEISSILFLSRLNYLHFFEPNTAYITSDATPAGFQQLKTCPNSKTIFIYPHSGPSNATSVDPTSASKTTKKIF
uniref:Uncharacterized protein n=1 Tax=Cacopsylla melanoneura TaxID=428564 RepID=A0A8D8YUN5_9HEMI